MTIGINQITKGMALSIDQSIFIIVDYSHVKPGKGSAFARIKLKNVETGQVLEKTYKTADKLEDIPLEERKMQYTYRSGDEFHFMDQVTFEEHVIMLDDMDKEVLDFLLDDLEVSGLIHEDKVLKVNLPMFIVTEISHTDPGLKGDSSRSGNKPAKIATGASIQVPLFVNTGDKVRIDTRTGEYVERTKE